MDFLNGRIRPIYLRYLAAAFGSALITSIYGIVDMAMVGKYQGPEGTAALAVVMPIWNVIYSLGMLAGIGGSVIFSTLRGQDPDHPQESNEYFSAALIAAVFFAAVCWLGLLFWEEELLTLFGARGSLLALAQRYLLPVKFTAPIFLFNQMLAAFLRNDGSPALATAAVLFGGVFNIFGDYFCVFTLDLGMLGAGLATSLEAVCSFALMLTHFFSKRCSLALVRPSRLLRKLKKIGVTGFSTFFLDVAMGILTVLFNRQILAYLGTDALAVYGVVANLSTFVQCCAYSVGQAAQPIISVNFGAGKGGRIRETLKYALAATAFFSLFWTALSLAVPNLYMKLFMAPTPQILEIAPAIVRCYSLSFLLLPLNIFSTYYFQALLEPAAAFVVSIARGALISGLLILLLPAAAGADALWLAMPITELVVAAYAAAKMAACTRRLPELP